MPRETEILAPVGNKDMLVAAVRCGADAVYLGAKDFSARRNADNFDIAELEEEINYCHLRNVKVYLTVNISVKESELEDAFNLVLSAYKKGIDGIIITDLGLASIIHEKIPDLPLHASTQLSVHSPAALPVLKDAGFIRVVIAREMSKTDIKEFCKKAEEVNIEVEAFVHGALCMCMSGQCLLSAFLGSRSGNRGLCAGPCRLPFKAPGGTGFDLSLKDLSLIDYAKKLGSLGVKSLKIEGRMKRPEYVAAATAVCRQSVYDGFVDPDIKEALCNVFSRSGFTAGYYENKLGKDMFGIRTKDDVLSSEKAFSKIHGLYRNELSKIPLKMSVAVKKDSPILLDLTCEEISVKTEGEPPEIAKSKAVTKEDVKKSLLKLGATPYYCSEIEIDLCDGVYIPASTLNELRRKAIEILDTERLKKSNKSTDVTYYHKPEIGNEIKTPEIYCRFESESQIPDNLSGISAIILPLESEPFDNDFGGIIKAVDIPRGILSEKEIADRLKKFRAKGFTVAFCGNLAAVRIAKENGFMVFGDTGLNVFNSKTAAALKNNGAFAVTVSPELKLGESAFKTELKKGIVAYGNIPLMIFKNCPLKNGRSCDGCDKNGFLTDRQGVKFPVRCRMGYSELLNSVPIWLADRMDELSHCDFITLYFTRETKQEAEKVIYSYKNNLPCNSEFTRGLYYRGVM